MRCFIYGLVFLFFMFHSGFSQVLQVQLLQQFPSPYLSDWQTNPNIALLNITNTNASLLKYKLRFSLQNSSGQEVIRGLSDSMQVASGATRVLRNTDLFALSGSSRYKRDMIEKIVRTNLLPEGFYTLEVELFDVTGFRLDVQQVSFYLAGISSPTLLYPLNKDVVLDINPRFSWNSPVQSAANFQVQYRFNLYESTPGANPWRIIQEQSPLFTTTIMNSTEYVFPLSASLLKKGAQYLWFIEAYNGNPGPGFGMPLGGETKYRSEFFTYDYQTSAGEVTTDLASLKELPLIPGRAYLRGLKNITITQTIDEYVLHGTAPLVLYFLGGDSLSLNVQIDHLRFLQGSLAQPIYKSGSIYASFPQSLQLPKEFGDLPIVLKELEFTPMRGLSVTTALNLQSPLGNTPRLEGTVQIKEAGISGVVGLQKQGDKPVWEFSSPFGSMQIDTISIDLAKMEGVTALQFHVPQANRPISLSKLPLRGGSVYVSHLFKDSLHIPIADSLLQITWKNGTIQAQANLTEKKAFWDIQASVAMSFQLPNAQPLRGQGVLALSSEQGISIQQASFLPDERVLQYEGFAAAFKNIKLNSLTLDSKGFDFALQTNFRFSTPQWSMEIPWLDSLQVSSAGLKIPAKTWNMPNFAITMAGVSLQVHSIHTQEYTMPLSVDKLGLLPISFSGNVHFNQMQGIEGIQFSERFRALQIPFENLSLQKPWQIEIPEITFTQDHPMLKWANSEVFLKMEQLGGVLSLSDSAQVLDPDKSFQISGAISLPQGIQSKQPAKANLMVSAAGGVQGEFMVPDISGQLGVLQYGLQKAQLSVVWNAQQKQFIMEGSPTLTVPWASDSLQVSGSFSMDLIAGKIMQSSLEVSHFTLPLPPENPMFSFSVQKALVSKDGLRIDGKQSLTGLMDSLEVVFEGAGFNWNTLALQEGRIYFNNPFDLELDFGSKLSWKATIPDSAKTLAQNKLSVPIPQGMSLRKEGLQLPDMIVPLPINIAGNSLDASIRLQNETVIGYAPPGFASGEAIISSLGQDVARIDRNGFTLLGDGLLQNIPDILRLGDGMYVYTKDDQGELVCEMETVSNGVRIKTRPGQKVRVQFPALQFGAQEPPEVSIVFDAIFNPFSFALEDGSLHFPDMNLNLEQFGVPLAIGSGEFTSTMGIRKAVFAARPVLLSSVLPQEFAVPLEIDENGWISTTFDFSKDWQYLLGGEDALLALGVSGAKGSIAASWKSFHFEMQLQSSIRLLRNGQWNSLAQATLQLSPTGLQLLDFTPDSALLVPQSMPDEQQLATMSTDALRDYLGNMQISLGDYSLGVQQFKMQSFSWSYKEGLDFLFDLSTVLAIPSARMFIPDIPDLRISPSGVQFPEITLQNSVMQKVPRIPLGAFAIQPVIVKIPAMEIPLNRAPDISLLQNTLQNVQFSFDILSVSNDIPQALQNLQYSVSDASFKNGFFQGDIDVKKLMPGQISPLEWGAMKLLVDSIGGSLVNETHDGLNAQGLVLQIQGRFDLPASLYNGPTPMANLQLGTQGLLSGKVDMPGTFQIVTPLCTLGVQSAYLDFMISPQEKKILAGGDWSVTANGFQASAGGQMVFDVLQGRVYSGGITTQVPLTIGIPTGKSPLFQFTLQGLAIDTAGLHMHGTQQMKLGEHSVSVQMDSVLFSLTQLKMKRGSMSFGSSFGLVASVNGSVPQWGSVKDMALEQLSSTAVGLQLPVEGLTIQDGALRLQGAASALLKYQGKPWGDVQSVFSEDFAFDIFTGKVAEGSVKISNHQSVLATIQKGSISFNLDGVIPDTIPLPSTDIAWLDLKASNIKPTVSGDSITIQGKNIILRLPALASLATDGSPIPSIEIEDVNLTVSRSTFKVLSGSISVTPKMDLSSLGLPFELTALQYDAVAIDAEQQLLGTLTPLLPEEWQEILPIENIVIGPNGIQGEVLKTNMEALVIHEDWCVLHLDTLYAKILMGSNAEANVRLRGKVQSRLLGEDVASALPFVIAWKDGQWDIALDSDAGADGAGALLQQELSLWGAKLRKDAVNAAPPVSFFMSEESGFGLSLQGLLELETLGKDFSLALNSLRISKNGIEMESLQQQVDRTFWLFGQEFIVKSMYLDVQGEGGGAPGIGLEGSANVFGKEVTLQEFRIGLDGVIQASVEAENIVIVENMLKFNGLKISDNALHIQGSFVPPEPFASLEAQKFELGISAAGEMQGGNTLVIYEANQANQDALLIEFWKFSMGMKYLAFALDLDDWRNSAIQLNGFMNLGADTILQLGSIDSYGSVTPGYTLTLNGTQNWNTQMEMPEELSSIAVDLGILALNLSDIAPAVNGSSFGLSVNGKVSLNVGDAVSSTINLNQMQFDSKGLKETFTSYLKGGQLSIGKDFTFGFEQLQTGNFTVDHGETTITVSDGFFLQKTSMSLSDWASGGVDKVLLYMWEDSPNIKVSNLNVDIPGGSTLQASLDYMQDDAGFRFDVRGSLELQNMLNLAVAGKLGYYKSNFSMGLFALLPTGGIPLGGGVLLTSVMGGVFINPDTQDQNKITDVLNLPQAPENVNLEGSSFAVFVGGDVVFIGDKFAKGRALMMLSDKALQLMGKVQMLNLDEQAQGTFLFTVKEEGVNGTANIIMDVPGVQAEGQLTCGFTTSEWSILGTLTSEIIHKKVLEADMDFYIGNLGFTLGGMAQAGFSAGKLLKVSAEARGRVWMLYGDNWETGGYAGMSAKIELIWGLITARGDLDAMMKLTEEELRAMGQAYGKACVNLVFKKKCASGYAWANMASTSPHFKGGLGKNTAVSDELERVKNLNDVFAKAAQDAKAKMEAARADALTLTPKQLELAGAQLYMGLNQQDTMNMWLDKEKEWQTMTTFYLDESYNEEALPNAMETMIGYTAIDTVGKSMANPVPNVQDALDKAQEAISSVSDLVEGLNIPVSTMDLEVPEPELDDSATKREPELDDSATKSEQRYSSFLESLDMEQYQEQVLQLEQTNTDNQAYAEQARQAILDQGEWLANEVLPQQFAVVDVYNHFLDEYSTFLKSYSMYQQSNMRYILYLNTRKAALAHMQAQRASMEALFTTFAMRSPDTTNKKVILERSKIIESLSDSINLYSATQSILQTATTPDLQVLAVQRGLDLWLDIPHAGMELLVGFSLDSLLGKSVQQYYASLDTLHRLQAEYTAFLNLYFDYYRDQMLQLVSLCDAWLNTYGADYAGSEEIIKIESLRGRLADRINDVILVPQLQVTMQDYGIGSTKLSINLQPRDFYTASLALSYPYSNSLGYSKNLGSWANHSEYFFSKETTVHSIPITANLDLRSVTGISTNVQFSLSIPFSYDRDMSIATPALTWGDVYKDTIHLQDSTPPIVTSVSAKRWQSSLQAVLEATINAADPESDIGEYAYTLQQTNANDKVLAIDTIGRMESFSIYNLQLQHNTTYRLQANAQNTAGLWGNWTQTLISIDTTPPLKPVLASVQQTGENRPIFVSEYQSAGVVVSHNGFYINIPQEQDATLLQSHFIPAPQGFERRYEESGDALEMRISLRNAKALDKESPVERYLFKLSTSAVDSDSLQGWYITDQTDDGYANPVLVFKGGSLQWGNEVYVHVRALNSAGLVGEALVTGPLKPRDFTRPSAPVFALRSTHNNASSVLMHLQKTAIDVHSGIDGYEYKVVETGYGLIQDWQSLSQPQAYPAGTKDLTRTLDMALRSAVTFSGNKSNTVYYSSEPILTTTANGTVLPLEVYEMSLPERVKGREVLLTVYVRAVNGDGLVSEEVPLQFLFDAYHSNTEFAYYSKEKNDILFMYHDIPSDAAYVMSHLYTVHNGQVQYVAGDTVPHHYTQIAIPLEIMGNTGTFHSSTAVQATQSKESLNSPSTLPNIPESVQQNVMQQGYALEYVLVSASVDSAANVSEIRTKAFTRQDLEAFAHQYQEYMGGLISEYTDRYNEGREVHEREVLRAPQSQLEAGSKSGASLGHALGTGSILYFSPAQVNQNAIQQTIK
jgi:hypothetical protein